MPRTLWLPNSGQLSPIRTTSAVASWLFENAPVAIFGTLAGRQPHCAMEDLPRYLTHRGIAERAEPAGSHPGGFSVRSYDPLFCLWSKCLAEIEAVTTRRSAISRHRPIENNERLPIAVDARRCCRKTRKSLNECSHWDLQ